MACRCREVTAGWSRSVAKRLWGSRGTPALLTLCGVFWSAEPTRTNCIP